MPATGVTQSSPWHAVAGLRRTSLAETGWTWNGCEQLPFVSWRTSIGAPAYALTRPSGAVNSVIRSIARSWSLPAVDPEIATAPLAEVVRVTVAPSLSVIGSETAVVAK